MKIIEPQAGFINGVIQGEKVKSYKKLLGEMKDAYIDTENTEPDTLLYTTYSYEAEDSARAGDLYFGLTVLEPVTVNGECCMTRGHFHLERSCAEIYFGISGSGLLLLMDDEGVTWAEKVEKGSIHHIAGNLAHRLINTGEEQLKVGACWPTVAGHDYEAIEKKNFAYRIFKKGDEIKWEDDVK